MHYYTILHSHQFSSKYYQDPLTTSVSGAFSKSHMVQEVMSQHAQFLHCRNIAQYYIHAMQLQCTTVDMSQFLYFSSCSICYLSSIYPWYSTYPEVQSVHLSWVSLVHSPIALMLLKFWEGLSSWCSTFHQDI